jgi:Arc/MetJ-type ribon-helix-helix transcriptional regulator
VKVLLDENLPYLLRNNLGDHDVFTVSYKGRAGRLQKMCCHPWTGKSSRTRCSDIPPIVPPRRVPAKVLRHLLLSRTMKPMDVQLTSDQKAFARRAIESGRLHSEQDAVQEALALWEEHERQRAEFLLTLDDARASLARGEGRVITPENMQQLASEVKERARARLLAELALPR